MSTFMDGHVREQKRRGAALRRIDKAALASASRADKHRRDANALGREKNGLTRALRDAKPIIDSLLAEHVTWTSIASAMTGQGFVQGKAGGPVTASRLTALWYQINEQDRRKAAEASKRAFRSDLVQPGGRHMRVVEALSKLIPLPRADSAESEEAIRRTSFKEIQSLMKE
jgi:hypothetical protein